MSQLFAFLIGISFVIDVTLGGRFRLAEIIFLGVVPFYSKSLLAIAKLKRGRWFLGAAVLYCASIVISEWHNGTSILSFGKSIAKPVLIVTYVTVFYSWFVKDRRILGYWLVGVAVGALARFWYVSSYISMDTEYNEFVFRYEPMVIGWLCAVLWFQWKRLPAVCVALLFLMSCALVTFTTRNSVATLMLAGLLLLLRASVRGGGEASVARLRGYLRRVIYIGGLACVALYCGYVYLAPRGYLGELQKGKFLTESQTAYGATPWGLLAADRSSVVGAILGIFDHPLVGNGSENPKIMDYQIRAMMDAKIGVDGESAKQLIEARSGAGHSIIFGEWMLYGVLAAVFWIICLRMVVECGMVFLWNNDALLGIYVLLLLIFAWAFIFSPLTVELRMYIGLLLAIAIGVELEMGSGRIGVGANGNGMPRAMARRGGGNLNRGP